MKSRQFAKIAIRILALFLLYRGLEFGISQMVQSQISIGMMQSSDITGEALKNPKISQAIKSLRIMTGIGAMVPLFLAGVLWFAAPVLSRRLVGSTEDSQLKDDDLPLQAILIQTAAIILIAVAFSTLPKIIYDFQLDHRKDPSITLMTSRFFPDAIQLLSKVFVSGLMLVAIKKKRMSSKIPGTDSRD